MATKNSSSKTTPRRASQRLVISIDLAKEQLKWLMVEQCATQGYLTVYRGTRQELSDAGVPDEAFPPTKSAKHFQVNTINVCCSGSAEILNGSMCQLGNAFELEIDWGHVRPYTQATHPALVELARMILKDVCAWTQDDTMEGPFIRLAADPRAIDFKPISSERQYQVTPEFHQRLKVAYREIFDMIYTHGEILVMPVSATTKAKESPDRPALRLVRAVG